MSSNIKLASALNRRLFLLECKRRHLTLNHIGMNTNNIQRLFEIGASTKFNRKLEIFREDSSAKNKSCKLQKQSYEKDE